MDEKENETIIVRHIHEEEVKPAPVASAPAPVAPEFDYAKIAAALQPHIEASVQKILEAQPAYAKGVPAIMKYAKLGSKNDMANEVMHFIKTGQMPFERNALYNSSWESDPAVKAAMQEATGSEGGYIVPDDFYAQIVAKRDEASIARMAGARVIPTSLKVVNVPIENTASTWSITAEEGAVNEAEPTLNQVAITVYNHTNLIKISNELLADQAADLDSFLTSHLGKTLAKQENKEFLVGTGTGDPQGVYVGGTAGLTLDFQTSVGAGEIPELMYKLKAEYFDGAVWSMQNATLGYVLGLTGDAFQFIPTPAGGLQPSLMFKPVYPSSQNAAMTSGLKSMVFGNWFYYGIAQNSGLMIQRNPWLYMGTSQTGFFSNARFGGRVLQAEAFQYGTQA